MICIFVYDFLYKFPLKNPLDRFQKEQNLFLSQAKSSMSGSGVAPWVGHVKEEALKEEVLGLSGVSFVIIIGTLKYCANFGTNFGILNT